MAKASEKLTPFERRVVDGIRYAVDNGKDLSWLATHLGYTPGTIRSAATKVRREKGVDVPLMLSAQTLERKRLREEMGVDTDVGFLRVYLAYRETYTSQGGREALATWAPRELERDPKDFYRVLRLVSQRVGFPIPKPREPDLNGSVRYAFYLALRRSCA